MTITHTHYSNFKIEIFCLHLKLFNNGPDPPHLLVMYIPKLSEFVDRRPVISEFDGLTDTVQNID